MKRFLFVLFCLAASVSLFGQTWTPSQEAEVKGLFRNGGFFLALQNVGRGEADPAVLRPWLSKIEETTLVGTTVRDTLLALPAAADAWLLPLLATTEPGAQRSWLLERRQDPARVRTGKFHLSLHPVRMDLVSGVSMILPNYDWGISYQDPRQMTVQALEKGYSATVHLRWIDPSELVVFDTARLVQMYAGFRPRYIVKAPAGVPEEDDLVPLAAVEPQPLDGHPGVREQVQLGVPEAWQLYAGRTRWYQVNGRLLVVLISVHIERDQQLADQDRAMAKLGLLLDTLQIQP